MPTDTPQFQKNTAPVMPPFLQANPNQIEQTATAMDEQAYGLSDADFKARYPQLYQAQQNDINNVNSGMSGNVTPQLQNLWARSGLTNALGSTGSWSLGTGTPGIANVARNLGLNQMQYQQQLQTQFQTANDTFRPRTFGLSGADSAQIALQNIAGQNNWNASNYAYQFENNQFNTGIANQQSVASSNAENAQTSGIVGSAGSAVSALAIVAFCWCARECLKEGDPSWLEFRHWLLWNAPRVLRKMYARQGRGLAGFLSTRPILRNLSRALMLGILKIEKRRIFLLSDLLLAGFSSAFYWLLVLWGSPKSNFQESNRHRYYSSPSSFLPAFLPCPIGSF